MSEWIDDKGALHRIIATVSDDVTVSVAPSPLEALAVALPYTPGRWIEQVKPIDTHTLWHDVDDGRLCIISIGDGCTTLSKYTWQFTAHRPDGLHEHIYERATGG